MSENISDSNMDIDASTDTLETMVDYEAQAVPIVHSPATAAFNGELAKYIKLPFMGEEGINEDDIDFEALNRLSRPERYTFPHLESTDENYCVYRIPRPKGGSDVSTQAEKNENGDWVVTASCDEPEEGYETQVMVVPGNFPEAPRSHRVSGGTIILEWRLTHRKPDRDSEFLRNYFVEVSKSWARNQKSTRASKTGSKRKRSVKDVGVKREKDKA